MTKSAARASILGKIAPNLLNAETGYLDGFKLNVEELLKVNPDVFLRIRYWKVWKSSRNLECLL